MDGNPMKKAIRSLMIALLALPLALQAADDAAAAVDPVMQQAREAASRKDFAAAAALLRDALAKTPANPDYHNLYAYAVRNGPHPNMDLVFKHYTEALRLAPKHRGAHEYIGEAYLMVGDVPKARAHLTQLDRLCFFGCAEYSSLKQAIRDHEAKGAR
jgi:tetratricopeptide (TPR) repeat protein